MCEFIMWKPGSQWQRQLASLDLGFLAYLLMSPFTPSTAVPFIKELVLLMQVNPLFIPISLFVFAINSPHSLSPLFFDMYTDHHVQANGYMKFERNTFCCFGIPIFEHSLITKPISFGRLSKQRQLSFVGTTFDLEYGLSTVYLETYWPYSGSRSKYLLVVWFHFMDCYFRKINAALCLIVSSRSWLSGCCVSVMAQRQVISNPHVAPSPGLE